MDSEARTSADSPTAVWPVTALGLGLVLIVALVRLTAVLEPFPYWGSDPLRMYTPTTGITPFVSAVMDAVALFGAAMVLVGEIRRGRGLGVWEVVCFAGGAVVAGLHALKVDGGSIDNQITGGLWVSAVASGVAASVAAREPRLRMFMTAVLLGAVAAMAGKGALQLLVEHPETVRTYRETRDVFLASEGWAPDSAMARAFERRLFQAEASGWFGLSNVYASVAAGSLVGLTGLALAAWRKDRRRGEPEDGGGLRWLLVVGALAAAVALGMSKSKGGIGAALVGLGLLAVATFGPRFLPRSRRAGAMLAIAVPMAVLLAVVARGLVGERIGELSLLFRWFYMQGAARIFGSHPLFGVGPADFKDAYLLAKPALSTEEVTSPHSVFWDYLATLGTGGALWVLLLLGWVAKIGVVLTRRDDEREEKSTGGQATSGTHQESFRGQATSATEEADRQSVSRDDARLLLVVAAIVTIAGAYLETPAVSVESTVMRLFALAGWVAIGVGCLWVLGRRGAEPARAGAIALGCAAMALIAHAQIEVTPVWPGAAAWFMMMVALAAGMADCGACSRRLEHATLRAPLIGGTGAFVMLVAAGAVVYAAMRIRVWERGLARAEEQARVVLELRENIGRALEDPQQRIAAARELSDRLGRTVGADPDSLRVAAQEMELVLLPKVQELLTAAESSSPDHFPTVRARSRVTLEYSDLLGHLGRAEEAARVRAQAEHEALTYAERHPQVSLAWGWLGTIRNGMAKDEGGQFHLRRAAEAWERAAALDPHGLQYAPDLARVYVLLGEGDRAAAWAERTLEINEQHRLDPLEQLREGDVAEMKRITGER